MNYVALLRGINVGGNTKVQMSTLKTCFETLGYSNVTTYINSGNVLFSAPSTDNLTLTKVIEDSIEATFDMKIPVLIIPAALLQQITERVPASWQNNPGMKCDVLFLWKDAKADEVLKIAIPNPMFDDVLVFQNVIVWRVDREHATKSKLLKIIGTAVYKQITIRNINTVRKLVAFDDARGQ